MRKAFELVQGKLAESASATAPILVFVDPDEAERRYLIDQLKIDEHTLMSALDPNELPRLEFEPDHAAIILNRPKRYSQQDNLFFRVDSMGVFLFADRLVVVLGEDVPIFDATKSLTRLGTLRSVMLRILYRSVFHFLDHLKGINLISDELEQKINTSLQNEYLIQLFTLEKGLVYLVSAIRYNGALIERLRHNAPKLSFSPEELELLDDLAIENNECCKQAEIHSNVVAGLMNARVSIVNNNLNQLIKRLNIIMIAVMWPTLACGIFSMNVKLPVAHEGTLGPFWFIMLLAFVPIIAGYFLFWRRNGQ